MATDHPPRRLQDDLARRVLGIPWKGRRGRHRKDRQKGYQIAINCPCGGSGRLRGKIGKSREKKNEPRKKKAKTGERKEPETLRAVGEDYVKQRKLWVHPGKTKIPPGRMKEGNRQTHP